MRACVCVSVSCLITSQVALLIFWMNLEWKTNTLVSVSHFRFHAFNTVCRQQVWWSGRKDSNAVALKSKMLSSFCAKPLHADRWRSSQCHNYRRRERGQGRVRSAWFCSDWHTQTFTILGVWFTEEDREFSERGPSQWSGGWESPSGVQRQSLSRRSGGRPKLIQNVKLVYNF